MFLSKDGQEYVNEVSGKASLTPTRRPIPRFLGAELCKRPFGFGMHQQWLQFFFSCPRKPSYNCPSLLGAGSLMI
jgi:hypothetical protein